MEKLILVRHGQSMTNKLKAGKRFFPDNLTRIPVESVPDPEIPLTPYGEFQAELTGKALAERFGPFDWAYHSGYRRTRDTLSIMLRQYDESVHGTIPIREDSGIRERDPGCLYNITVSEMMTWFPWWNDYRNQAGSFFAVPPGGGESLSDVVRWRARRFFDHISREHPRGNILVVTHGETLRCLRAVIETLELRLPDRSSPKNCGVTVYEYDSGEERLMLREYNTVYY